MTGRVGSDSQTVHFAVRANTTADAIQVVRASGAGQRYDRVDIVSEKCIPEIDEPRIVAEGSEPYVEEA